MCKSATCLTCQKTTWWGCGAHIPQALAPTPDAERCSCTPTIEIAGKQYPPMAKAAPEGYTGRGPAGDGGAKGPGVGVAYEP